MLNFRLELCFAHRTPPGALIQRICGAKRREGTANARGQPRGVNFFGDLR
jgi:hypothetical protein